MGDLHDEKFSLPSRGNDGSRYIFFDWDSCFLGWPFLEQQDPEWVPLFRQQTAYLTSWKNYAAPDVIENLATLSKPVVSLVSAIVALRSDRFESDVEGEMLCELHSFFKDIPKFEK